MAAFTAGLRVESLSELGWSFRRGFENDTVMDTSYYCVDR
jgi:hypothetical protein